MLKQYFEIKAQYPEAILLYRVGDFYETYGDDTLKASRLLGIVLTRKSSGGGSFIEMAGIPTTPSTTTCPAWSRRAAK